jgi:predicted nucleotidyltransferase
MGIMMPDMGRKSSHAAPGTSDEGVRRISLIDALFSSTQQRVLGLLFGQPERSFFATEIIGLLGAGSGGVQRELRRLAESGLVTVSRIGNQKHYQANPASPVYDELCALVRKTVGLAEPLRRALEPESRSIKLALVYGSVAKGQPTAASDIDLLVVSDSLMLEDIFRLLTDAERLLDRKVNPTVYTSEEFGRRLRERNPFLERVLGGEYVLLMGQLPDVA